MDKAARNTVERATQQARKLLDDDLSSHLEGTFDVLRSGVIASNGGTHLSAFQQSQRDKIVAAIGHKRASGITALEAVADYVRDAAFTTLNRFVALKMLEARALVQECITKGEQSAGYREFCGMAPGVALLPDGAGYRLYIESLFDEFSTEIKVLFDRRDPATVLWPKRQTFEALLTILNAPDLSDVWGEDETIGWVYQYFNSEQERRGMRAESLTPRTGAELAVRNQFFTPRYVVEFLVSNTLGRLWHDMRRGQTRLKSECPYLIRRPTEIFLAEGEYPPQNVSASDDFPAADLLKAPAYVQYRPKKDPRDLKILDPACGSGHFLLFGFDLLETIYEEGWADDTAPISEASQRSLRQDYPTLGELREAIPGLVLRYNLYGVDIDSRATQIARFALWMRAQRSYNQFAVPRSRRAATASTNVVLAEAMPGEEELRREFVTSLDMALRPVVEQVFDKMNLAGEAGTLLKIDREIQDAVRKHSASAGPLFHRAQEQQWTQIENTVNVALAEYVAQGGPRESYLHRLFSEDAARGLAFIEVSYGRYDVVLMNPPFGEFLDPLFSWLAKEYPRSKRDLAACFVDRALELLAPSGVIGALFSRKLLFLSTQGAWRRHLIERGRFYPVADLGHRVLDGALVEVAAAVFSDQKGESLFISCLDADDKAAALRPDIWPTRSKVSNAEAFLALPSAQLSYETPTSVLKLFETSTPLEPTVAVVRNGLTSMDNERFVRLFWELPQVAASVWSPISKGGEYSPYYGEDHLLIKWEGGRGEMAAFNLDLGNEAQSRRGFRHYFVPSLTYSKRTASSFFARVLPAGNIFTDKGLAVIPNDPADIWRVLAVLNTQLFSTLVDLCVGGGDTTSSGSAARDYTSGLVGMLPFPGPERLASIPEEPVRALVNARITVSATEETSRLFLGHGRDLQTHRSIHELAESWLRIREDTLLCSIRDSVSIEDAVADAYGIDATTAQQLSRIAGGHPGRFPTNILIPANEFSRLYYCSDDEIVDEVAKVVGAQRSIVLKSYIADRKYELLSHAFAANPEQVIEMRRRLRLLPPYELTRAAQAVVSYCVGLEFGRWNWMSRSHPEVDLIAAGLPRIQPGAEQEVPRRSIARAGIRVDDPGHPDDLVERLHQVFLSASADPETLEAEVLEAF